MCAWMSVALRLKTDCVVAVDEANAVRYCTVFTHSMHAPPPTAGTHAHLTCRSTEMLRRLKRYKHANMTCAVAKHKTDSRFAERDALPDYISTHDEVVKHTRVTARHCTRVHVLPTVLVSSTALHCTRVHVMPAVLVPSTALHCMRSPDASLRLHCIT